MKHLVLAASFLSGFAAFLLLRPRSASASLPQLSGAQKTASGTLPKSNPQTWNIKSTVPTLNDSPAAHAGNYVTHLKNAAAAVEVIENGAETHDESLAVNEAYNNLSIPIDTLTAQKDLNVLGAQPPLVEDGVMGPKTRDAIDSFQRAMLIEPVTGVMDGPTSNALRRALVAVVTPDSSATS